MTNNIFKSNMGVFALIGLLTLASCSDREEMPVAAGGNEAADFSLAIKGMPAAVAGAPAADAQDALSVFQFGPDGLFSKNIISRRRLQV